MTTEYGRGPAPGSDSPRRDPEGRQATAESPVVPPPRTSDGPTGVYTGSHRAADEYAYGTDYETGSVAATGFTWLAASLMLIGGLFGFFTGLEAVARGNFYLVTSNNYLYNINIHGWGWIHIIIGGLVFVAGIALFARQNWARVVGIVLAGVSAVMNFLFIPHYPLWAIVIIALNVVIIWALTSTWRRSAY